MKRLVKREPFPRDRQTFAYRPSELVGLAVGISAAEGRSSASAGWIRSVIQELPGKSPPTNAWALLLYHYAASIVGIQFPLAIPARLSEYESPSWIARCPSGSKQGVQGIRFRAKCSPERLAGASGYGKPYCSNRKTLRHCMVPFAEPEKPSLDTRAANGVSTCKSVRSPDSNDYDYETENPLPRGESIERDTTGAEQRVSRDRSQDSGF